MNNKFQFCNDEQLIHFFQEDQAELAFEVLLERHKNAIYTNIYFTVRDNFVADEIFQDAFIKIFQHLQAGKYKEQGKFLPWAQRIASNLCIDYFRKQKRQKRYLINNGDDLLPRLSISDNKHREKEMIQEETAEIVLDLLSQLPEEQREVITLRIYGEHSFKEIAKLTDVSINTALGRMRYGLQNLRKTIQQNNIAVR